MYRLRVSKSCGGESPLKMIGCYGFVNKSIAITEAMSSVPDNSKIEWANPNKDEIKFRFRVDNVIYQFWIDKFPAVYNLLDDTSITDLPCWSSEKGYHYQ